ncbi:MAG: cytochrome c [Chloroflexales bacterium]|nr:cytochrome c [Chloroflexales bacterium]
MTPVRLLLWAALVLALAACGAAAPPTPVPPPTLDPLAEGRRMHLIWCSGCHAVEAGAPAGLGPNLAGVATLAAANPDGLSAEAWLRREILDPNAVTTEGYPPGLMPLIYGQSLSAEQLDALVAFLLTLE